jgi:hypothetical protein
VRALLRNITACQMQDESSIEREIPCGLHDKGTLEFRFGYIAAGRGHVVDTQLQQWNVEPVCPCPSRMKPVEW